MKHKITQALLVVSLLVGFLSLIDPLESLAQGGSGRVEGKHSTPTKPKTKSTSKSSNNNSQSNSPSTPETQPTEDEKPNDSKSVEMTFWESIRSSTNPDDFRSYLRKYPDGQFADLARNRISSLEEADREARAAEARRVEAAYWDSIKNSNSVADFHLYLDRYPNGAFADIARNRINTMEAAAREADERRREDKERADAQRRVLERAERKITEQEESTGLYKSADGKVHPVAGYRWIHPNDPKDFGVELIPGIYRTETGGVRPKTGYRWFNPFDATNFNVELMPGVTTPVEVAAENIFRFSVTHYHVTKWSGGRDPSCQGTIKAQLDGTMEFISDTKPSHNITFTCSTITNLRFPPEYSTEVKFSFSGHGQDFLSEEFKNYIQKKCRP